MKPRVLVVSTVHPADDPRIRRKLIGTLRDEWEVTYAARGRAPIDQSGLEWRELTGNRFLRWLRAGALLLRGRYDVASLHDPELLPWGLLASLRRTVVFDVHENIPAQIRDKEWVPSPLRRPLAGAMHWLLRRAEKRMPITLAEAGYRSLFRRHHPVFANYLFGEPPPPREIDPDTGLLYLGDVTAARGVVVAVEAAVRAGVKRFSIVGRCSPELRSQLTDMAASGGLDLRFHGFLPPDRALDIAAGAVLGMSPLLDLPNYRQSLPTKVLEYLAVGIPTLASDLPGTRDIVGELPGVVLLAPGDIDEWADAIRAVMESDEVRQAAAEGADAVRRQYVWPREEVADFYRALPRP